MVTGHACHLSSTYSLILRLLPPASQQLVKSTFNLLHMAKTQLADTNAHSSIHPQWRPHSSGDKCHTFIREESHKEEVHGKKDSQQQRTSMFRTIDYSLESNHIY